MPDLIGELMARLQAAMGTGGRVTLGEIERAVRRDWGGRWVYLSRRADTAQRDARIVDALRSGEPPPRVAEQFGLSERRVRQIRRSIK